MEQIDSNLRRLCDVENTPFEILWKWERVLPDLFRRFRRLDASVLLWGFVV